MAAPFQKNGRGAWYVRVKNGAGRWVNVRTSARTKTEAREFERELAMRFDKERKGLSPSMPTNGGGTFRDLLQWWLHERPSQSAFSHKHKLSAVTLHLLGSELADLPLNALSPERVEAWAQDKAKEPSQWRNRITGALSARPGRKSLAPKYINLLLGYGSAAFNSAIEVGRYLGANPFDRVKPRKVPDRAPSILTLEQVGPTLREVPPQWQSFVAVSLYTGLRKGSIAGLQKRDVDLVGGNLTVTRSWESNTPKGKRLFTIPIHPELRPYLEDAIERSPSNLVFPRADGTMHSRHVDVVGIIRSAMTRAGFADGYDHGCRICKKAGRPSAPVRHLDDQARRCDACGAKLWPRAVASRVRFHDLRHTTATLLLKAHVPLAIVSRICGHSSIAITMKTYGHLDLGDMRAGLERLSFAPPAPSGETSELELGQAYGTDDSAPFAPPLLQRGPNLPDHATRELATPRALMGKISGPSWIRTKDQSVMSRQL